MRRNTTHRAGFTLTELLAVIVIITILIAFLLPSLGAIRNRAKLAQVSVDIKSLETGITTFQVAFGATPPSRIVLSELESGWDTRSRSIIRTLFPQFDFAAQQRENPFDPSSPLLPGRDFDGDGVSDKVFVLTGSECLVFWLGGPNVMRDGVPTGFSKNPRDPFAIDSGSRIGPFTEFDLTRFVDVDGDGVPEYVDTLQSGETPYLYLSGYGGKGYAPNYDADVLLPHATFSDSPPDTRPDIGLDTNGDGFTDTGRVYYQDKALKVPWKRDSYQIISPGFDGEYGTGGFYRKDVELKGVAPADLGPENISREDWDNITNFSGQLMP